LATGATPQIHTYTLFLLSTLLVATITHLIVTDTIKVAMREMIFDFETIYLFQNSVVSVGEVAIFFCPSSGLGYHIADTIWA